MLPKTLQLAEGILYKNRGSLAKAITLIESANLEHRVQANLLLEELAKTCKHTHFNQERLDKLNKYFELNEQEPNLLEKNNEYKGFFQQGFPSFRIGVAGPPGAGKSTFIEQFGLKIIERGHRVSVVPVDPSSHISGGSILGDKTRMENLSRQTDSYIRASPSRCYLGGIAEHTNDIISLCEYSGYDVVIVESVGLGQSEVDIDEAVDILLLIIPPGNGDSLQASKKGIMEAADLILINKADGNLLPVARHTKADYSGSLQFIKRKHMDWEPEVLLVSSHTGLNIDKAVDKIFSFYKVMLKNNEIFHKRNKQSKFWAEGHLRNDLLKAIYNMDGFSEDWNKIKEEIEAGKKTTRSGAKEMIQRLNISYNKQDKSF